MTHLDALELGLSNEKIRLASATCPNEIKLRKVWIAQTEREIASELEFLGLTPGDDNTSDADLLAKLGL
jgi:hypothetical protein